MGWLTGNKVAEEVNIVEPLHNIQASIYEILELEKQGQDGVLLQFLVKHFWFKTFM